MTPERARSLRRSRPLIGAVSGFCAAFTSHVFGVPAQADLHDTLQTLFETEPAVGYVLYTVGGFTVAWVFRQIEDYGRE